MKIKNPVKRLIGTAVPVGALRTKHGMGVGEFSDIPVFAALCKKMRIGLIQLLPVNDTGFESSPYSSLTAFGLHPLYLRIEELEEFNPADNAIKKRIKEAKKEFENYKRFSHYKVLKEKLEICREIYNLCKTELVKSAFDGSGNLAKWIENNSWVKQYAVYRSLKEANESKSWKYWNEYNHVSMEEIESLWNDGTRREDQIFWVWLQEALDKQFTKAAEAVADCGIILKGDLPILMNEDSCDVWAHPEIFDLTLSAGAPPDMYSPAGQNWGFPVYNWEAQEKDNFAWWRMRLQVAQKYYKAYRLDHILGFFRIWASSKDDYSSALGRYVKYNPVTGGDLKKLGFDKGKIRWLSQPHISTAELTDAVKNGRGGSMTDDELQSALKKVFSKALDRVNNEELWLFKKKIKGEKNIQGLELHHSAVDYLINKWRDRLFYEYEKGKFFPTWYYRTSSAYKSLPDEEKNNLEAIIEKRQIKSDKLWEAQGKKLLSILVESSPMLPCAEDLGAVPACVPKVLSKLKIFALRVPRWFCDWGKEGQPFFPLEDYPKLSVCTPSVHDSSTMREWWEREVDQNKFAGFVGVPSLPKIYNPGSAKLILTKFAAARSCFRIFQIQDILHLSSRWYSEDPAEERINVPGTSNEFNWTYRLPANLEEIVKDKELIRSAAELSRVKAAKKK